MPGDGRLADVREYELGAVELMAGLDRVDRDHPVDVRIPLDAPHEAASQLPGRSCDEHDLAQDQRLPWVVESSGHRIRWRLRCDGPMTGFARAVA